VRNSLRFRLLAGAVLSLIAALVIAGIFISGNFAASLERERRGDLDVSVKRVVAQIDAEADPPIPKDNLLDDPRYDMPLSGSYWQVEDLDKGATYRSRSLWDSELTLKPSGTEGEVFRTAAPDGAPLIALTRQVEIESAAGPRHFRVIVAEARDDPDHPLQSFSLDLSAALAVLAVVLIAAAWVQISLGLAPLEAVTRSVEKVRRGELTRLPAGGPEELRPLVTEVNNVLEGNEAAISHARDRAADLAHGLKTPLAVVAATAERLAEARPEDSRVLRMIVAEMNERIDYQLRLARLRMRTPSHGARAPLNAALQRSVGELKRTPRGEQLAWMVELGPELDVDVDGHDLLELVGVVLENACKWAAGRVSVESRSADGFAHFVVQDDGAGVAAADIARRGARGERLDQSRPGDGLGLAIVFDAVRLNGGAIELGRSALGGLSVDVRLPLAPEESARS
jgi:signal transduction histidine kinase